MKIVEQQEEDKYNLIDKLHMEGIKFSTKRYQQIFRGNFPWSPTLQYARDKINLWTYVIKCHKKLRASASYIRRLERQVGVFHTSNTVLIEADRELNESYCRYRLVRNSALAMRISWMEELASRKTHIHGETSSSILLTIIHHKK